MIKIEDIPEAEWRLLASGVKYPENPEWWPDRHEGILEDVISEWKKAKPAKREKWIEDPRSFGEHIDPEMSDDDTDYIRPFYTYMDTGDILKNTPAKYFGTNIKRLIIQAQFLGEDEMISSAYGVSSKIEEQWDSLMPEGLEQAYRKGFVSQEFANFMKPYESDKDAWKALEVFYASLDWI